MTDSSTVKGCREGKGGRLVTVKPCDRRRGNSVRLIKAAVEVIQFVGKSIVGSGNILWRRLVVGYVLQTLPDVLTVVGGEIFLKLVPVFGLSGF